MRLPTAPTAKIQPSKTKFKSGGVLHNRHAEEASSRAALVSGAEAARKQKEPVSAPPAVEEPVQCMKQVEKSSAQDDRPRDAGGKRSAREAGLGGAGTAKQPRPS